MSDKPATTTDAPTLEQVIKLADEANAFRRQGDAILQRIVPSTPHEMDMLLSGLRKALRTRHETGGIDQTTAMWERRDLQSMIDRLWELFRSRPVKTPTLQVVEPNGTPQPVA